MAGFSALPRARPLDTLLSVAAHRLPASEPSTARAGDGDEDKGPRLAGFVRHAHSLRRAYLVMPFIHGGQTRADPPGKK